MCGAGRGASRAATSASKLSDRAVDATAGVAATLGSMALAGTEASRKAGTLARAARRKAGVMVIPFKFGLSTVLRVMPVCVNCG